jgi:hypothetical protein
MKLFSNAIKLWGFVRCLRRSASIANMPEEIWLGLSISGR